jgi:hypothetical protein
VLYRIETEAVDIQLFLKPDHPRTRLIAHVLSSAATTMFGVEVANVGSPEFLSAEVTRRAVMACVGVKIIGAFWPAARFVSTEAVILESLEFAALRVRVLVSAAHVVKHDIRIDLEPIRMSDGNQAKQLVLGPEFGSNGCLLILVTEVVKIEWVVSHGETAASTLAGGGNPYPVEAQVA